MNIDPRLINLHSNRWLFIVSLGLYNKEFVSYQVSIIINTVRNTEVKTIV